MALLGVLWLAGQLMYDPDSPPLVFTVGLILSDAWVVGLVLFLVTFPEGHRLIAHRRRADRAVRARDPRPRADLAAVLGYRAARQRAARLAESRPRERHRLGASASCCVSGSLVLAAVLARRWVRASRPLRRRLTPIVFGGATLVVSTGNLILAKVTDGPPNQTLQNLVLAALRRRPHRRARRHPARAARRASAVGRPRPRAEPRTGEPAHLRGALARALGDPDLQVAYWLPEFDALRRRRRASRWSCPTSTRAASRAWSTATGEPRRRASCTTPRCASEPALLDAVGAAAGHRARERAPARRAARAARRAARARGRASSRPAMPSAGDSSATCTTGRSSGCVALVARAGDARGARSSDDPDARRAARRRRAASSTRSLEELRELARGIHPAVLSGHGLEVALEGLAARAPVPVRLNVELARPAAPGGRGRRLLPRLGERSPTSAKYAQASTAQRRRRARQRRRRASMSSTTASAAPTPTAGSGLRGLADRVEALGGRLRVTSPPGDGTRLHAEIPCG